MKSILRKFLVIAFTGLQYLYSQTDSTQINYSQENADSSDYYYHRKYQYLYINLKDETKLFKVALPTFSISYNKNVQGSSISKNSLGLLFTFERKLSKPLSCYLENENSYFREAYEPYNDYQFTSTINWGVRYYLFITKRIKEGTSGNNCNGVYTDLLIRGFNGVGYSKEDYDGLNPYKKGKFNIKVFNVPELRLTLGLQERLNNFSYMDARFYVSYVPDKTDYLTTKFFMDEHGNLVLNNPKLYQNIIIGLDFRIGLGWGRK